MYHALLEFPTLAASKPDKVPDYLPDNVTYDASTTALTQTYRGGGQVTTILSTLAIPPISLIGDEIRSPPTQHP
jgi:hypothetical protein